MQIHWDPAAGGDRPRGSRGPGRGRAPRRRDGRHPLDRPTASGASARAGSRAPVLLAEALAGLRRPPRVLVSASAIGRLRQPRRRGAHRGRAARGAACRLLRRARTRLGERGRSRSRAGIRVVHPRFGMVLTPAGGALARMLPPFRLGAGGPLGGGQPVGELDRDRRRDRRDPSRPLDRRARRARSTPPRPSRSPAASFAATLGRVLERPALLPAPAPALKLLFGEMADTALLSSQRRVRGPAAGLGLHFPAIRRWRRRLRHVLGRVAFAHDRTQGRRSR